MFGRSRFSVLEGVAYRLGRHYGADTFVATASGTYEIIAP